MQKITLQEAWMIAFLFVAKMSYRSCETTCYSVLVLLHVAAAFGIDTRKYTHKVSVGDRSSSNGKKRKQQQQLSSKLD